MSAWCRPVPCSVVQVSACTPAHTSRCGTHAHMCAPSTHYLQDSEPITCLALSPDKHSLVAASRSLSVRLWDWTTGECRRTWKVSTHTHTPPAAAVTAAAEQPHAAAFSTRNSLSWGYSIRAPSSAAATAATLLLPQLTVPTRVHATVLPHKFLLSLPPSSPPCS